ncbi:MAG: hypothetical protein O2931_15735, partial [Planctomycetota bacterium]|nr:hypothetical protein [Planctomycetota bacterium]
RSFRTQNKSATAWRGGPLNGYYTRSAANLRGCWPRVDRSPSVRTNHKIHNRKNSPAQARRLSCIRDEPRFRV